MSSVRALFAGPGAFRALGPGRRGAVELASDRCAYARLESDWLLVAEPSLPFGPLSVAVAEFERLELGPGLAVRVTRSGLVLGIQVVSLERVRDRSRCSAGSVAFGTPSAVREACAAAAAALSDPPEVLREGIAALAAGRVVAAVGSLAGVGEGLTPAGDDVLAGYSAARAALGSPVTLSPSAAGRSSPLGLAYLRCADRCELPDAGARFLDAICRGVPDKVGAACRGLSAWGATSGIALGWGLVAGVISAPWGGVSVAGSGPPAAASMGPPGPFRSGSAGRDARRRPRPGRVSRHSSPPHR